MPNTPSPGLFEAASGGTLFLDEIEALPLALQGKLLTVLEGKWVRRLGAVAERAVDVKLIAVTQVALHGLVTAGRYRADLYHRLAVVVLDARVDRLPAEAKALLQTLAVLGKECSFSLLTKVVDQPEGKLQRVLTYLQAAEFLYEQPGVPEPKYTFKHALMQDVVYASLPREQRRRLHERAAHAIEALFHDRLAEHYSELAHHYRRNGNNAKGVGYLQQAGQQAE